MRTRGSVRFDTYYKVQYYDHTSLCWRDIQRAHPTADAAAASYDGTRSDTWRTVTIATTGRTFGATEIIAQTA